MMEHPPTLLMTVGPWIRWSVWVAAVATLTVALLTSEPARVAGATLPPDTNFLASKTVHVLSYLILALLTAWLPLLPVRRRWLLGFLVAHAFLTELLQHFVPGRTGSLRDACLDVVGLALGVVLTWRCWRVGRR